MGGGVIWVGLADEVDSLANCKVLNSTKGAIGLFLLDSSFNLVWCPIKRSFLDLTVLVQVKALDESTFIAIGWTTDSSYEVDIQCQYPASYLRYKGVVIAFDIHGNILWRKCLSTSTDFYVRTLLISPISKDIIVSVDAVQTDGDLKSAANYGAADLYLVGISSLTGLEYPYEDSYIKVYPNPSMDMVRIDFRERSHNAPYQIGISTLLGQQVLTTESTQTAIDIDIRSLPVGIYMMEIAIDGQILRKKISKQ